EKKIIDITLNKSRTGSDIIDTSALLHEEREFHQKLLLILDDYRKGVVMNLFQGHMPHIPDQRVVEIIPPQKEMAPLAPAAQNNITSDSKSPTKIKFIMPMPSFVWKDLKQYGPFDTGEELEIYPEVAELIVRKGRAVKV
ncbi:MAG TPA: hypothetical protein VJI32_07080, partial [Candidatus Nanoarchaeia archaeon]|nr:hypothetical protein [Candidatus Nanoarchaeia archaeon]